MKKIKLLLIILTIISLGLSVDNKALLAQENPEDLQSCQGSEGEVVDPASQACVIRDCDCNRIANNGKVGELICMEKRTVRNSSGQIQYACKFPNSPTGLSCDVIKFTCPGASSENTPVTADSTVAQTQDPVKPSIVCEEKLLKWDADKACDTQYNRNVSLDLWQGVTVDPKTGKCKQFYKPNHVLEDQKCGSSKSACEPGPVDLKCGTKICLPDGAEVCQETWRDEQCHEVTRVGRITGNMCKTETTLVDVTKTLETAATARLSNEGQEFGINITAGFKDRSTVHSSFKLTIDADTSANSEPKTIWDIAAVWLDGTRLTLNPNNYHPDNFNLSSLNSDFFVYLLTTRLSEEKYEGQSKVRIEFGDGSIKTGVIYMKIEPGWVGTTGPKTFEQMLNNLDKITITNPYTGDYFTLSMEQIRKFAQATIPGEIPNSDIYYSITIPVQFRDGSKLDSNATLTIKKSATTKTETIWDIIGIEVNGRNLTLNPANVQSNNFTFFENPQQIAQILNLQIPTQHTEIPIPALVKFQDGTTRDAELKIVLDPKGIGPASPKTPTEALSSIQSLSLQDPYSGTTYSFDPELIKNGLGQSITAYIPDQAEITLPISLVSAQGAYRSDSITVIYDPDNNSARSAAPVTASVNNTASDGVAPAAQVNLVPAERTCLVRGDTGANCIGLGFKQCLDTTALAGNLYIGFKFPGEQTSRYYQFESVTDEFPSIGYTDLGKIFMGLQKWDNNVSLIAQKKVNLPKDVTIIPITISDMRNESNINTVVVNANKVNNKPKGCD